MVKYFKGGFFLLITWVCLISCAKEAVQQENGLHLPDYAQGAKIYPGKNQVKISLLLAENISTCEIFWNKRAKSLKIDVKANPKDSIHQVIGDLPEGNYTFEIITSDQSEKASGVMLSTRVYGDKYTESLKNRVIKELGFYFQEEAFIEWLGPATGEVFVDLTYTGVDDKLHRARMDRNNTRNSLPGYKANTAIQYKTLYLPEKGAIDTFYTSPVTIPAPTYYSSAVAAIINKSGLVSGVYSHSFTALNDAVSYSSLRFEDKNRQPLSVFILKADLNDPKVSMTALMPNNRTSFALQTVKEMVEAKHRDGEVILAGTNADFFDWTPVAGVPWGPIFVNGSIIKNTAKNTGITYFAIQNDGKPKIGTFSSLAPAAYPGIRDLVGGGVRLVAQGKILPFNDLEKHPRTLVGYTKNNMVYLVVVDGRQPQHSVGMTYVELALLMYSLGVEEAINLDGGGSSTMVIKNNNTFGIVNKHSDASPRAVANGLGISIKN